MVAGVFAGLIRYKTLGFSKFRGCLWWILAIAMVGNFIINIKLTNS